MQNIKHMAESVTQKVSQALQTGPTDKIFTRATGCPFADVKNSMTAGPNGPIVMDPALMEKLQNFTREQIPPRNVHALGQGAYGKLTITGDITKYSKAVVFKPGSTTEFFSRLSGTFTEKGEAQTIRDLRGFAMKMYTEEGNWDLMTINTPVFAVRDVKPGPDNVHAFKRDPRNANWNLNQFWDFNANHPEGLHQIAMLYTDYIGTPRSLRYQDWFGCNTYSLINSENKRTWVKFHLRNMQGEKIGFSLEEATVVAAIEPEFLMKDVHKAITLGKYPKWKLMIQVMNEDEGYVNNYAFDCTKVWPETTFPLIEVGEIELNKLPTNYFAEVEQVGFSPGNLIPGIGASPDKLLQGRLFIYDDTQRYRIGPNHKQLPINAPRNAKVNNNYYGGHMYNTEDQKFPHYTPSVYGSLVGDPNAREPPLRADGPVDFYDYPGEGTYEDYFAQVKAFWNYLSKDQQEAMTKNLATSLSSVTEPKIVEMMIASFGQCSPDWARMVQEKIALIQSGEGKMQWQKQVEGWAKDLLA